MRYLEQRIEDLEQLVQELKVKLFRKEWKESPKPWEKAASDYLYNPSLTILPEPELETAFPVLGRFWNLKRIFWIQLLLSNQITWIPTILLI